MWQLPQCEPPLLRTFPLTHILWVTFMHKDSHCLKERGGRARESEREHFLCHLIESRPSHQVVLEKPYFPLAVRKQLLTGELGR